MTTHRSGNYPAYLPPRAKLGDRVVALALQGGASLGAYTWGVLDEILADGRLEIEGITGASAGAINAAAVGVGYTLGGRAGARDALRTFWEALARQAEATRRGWLDLPRAVLHALPRARSADAFYALTPRLVSDFAMDPATMEPLRGTLVRTLDLAVLGRSDALKVFVNASDVQTGQLEVFEGGEIDVDVICASCAVPFLFPPVEVAGRWFWDGGLLGNPAIEPVILGCETREAVLVETFHATSVTAPSTAAEVMTRTMELASLAGLHREIRSIELASETRADSPRPGASPVHLHTIPAHPALDLIPEKRGFRADVPYFHRLRDLGHQAAEEWLAVAVPTIEPVLQTTHQ
jgi:NTE family protein